MYRRWIKSAVVVALFNTVFPAMSADASAGKALYNTCIACHGDQGQGNPALKAPRLAGQSAAYLNIQLQHFKQGVRGSHPEDTGGQQMKAMAASLADQKAIDDVVAYIEELNGALPGKSLGGDIAHGKSYYEGICGACHGSKAQGNAALKAPALAGLDGEYLLLQFNHYKQGIRGSHPDDKLGKQMKAMAFTLPDEKSAVDVFSYIQSLPAAQ